MPVMNTVAATALADDAPHLLVVDDDRRIRDLLSRFLLSEGYRVTTAETAADARAKLEGLRFDLLILDVMMPGETGFNLARDLRASSSVPIIMLTARVEPHSRIEGLAIGADDYLGKPFEPRELSLRIAGILRRTRPAITPPIEVVCFGDFKFHIARGELKRGENIDCWRQHRARRWRGRHFPAMAVRPASALSTCRSTGCGERSSRIRQIRSLYRPCAALVTDW
jgi:CheY-like chemotaxis protein